MKLTLSPSPSKLKRHLGRFALWLGVTNMCTQPLPNLSGQAMHKPHMVLSEKNLTQIGQAKWEIWATQYQPKNKKTNQTNHWANRFKNYRGQNCMKWCHHGMDGRVIPWSQPLAYGCIIHVPHGYKKKIPTLHNAPCTSCHVTHKIPQNLENFMLLISLICNIQL